VYLLGLGQHIWSLIIKSSILPGISLSNVTVLSVLKLRCYNAQVIKYKKLWLECHNMTLDYFHRRIIFLIYFPINWKYSRLLNSPIHLGVGKIFDYHLPTTIDRLTTYFGLVVNIDFYSEWLRPTLLFSLACLLVLGK
jgi:hypothetical protein